MDRKKFLKQSLMGIGTIVAIPTSITSCSQDSGLIDVSDQDCSLSPNETAGPFPIKSPAQLARENIISDREGIPLLINLIIQDQSDGCNPLKDAIVDIWHCDADGNYSQYGGTSMQRTDYSDKNFLRGRQSTDANGQVSFISIFPGWYPGRAPHIHLEILDSNEHSLRITQIAFPKDICDSVYDSSGYNGEADTLNSRDNVFSDSLDGNLADSLTGDNTEGYILNKVIVV